MRVPVYIAGPYTGDPLRNTERAVRLARYAVDQGYAPYVPHALGFLGVYSSTDDSATEQRAVDCGLAWVRLVRQVPGSLLWVIARDDGSLSPGTAREVELWGGTVLDCLPWSEWLEVIGG